MIRPEVDLDCLKLVPDDYPNDFLNFFLVSDFFNAIVGLFLNIFNYSDNIDHFVFDVVVLMLPMVVLLGESAGDLLFVEQMKTIVLFSEFYIRSPLRLNKLQPFDIIALANLQLFLLLHRQLSQEVEPHHITARV